MSVWKIEDIIYFDSCTRTIWLFKIPHTYICKFTVPMYNVCKNYTIQINCLMSYAIHMLWCVCVFLSVIVVFAEDYKYENVVNKRIKVVYFLIHIAFHIRICMQTNHFSFVLFCSLYMSFYRKNKI